MTDERRGFPSCSELGRINACPASHLRGREAAKGLKPQKNNAAYSGTRVHDYLDGKPVDLDIWEQAIADQCRELEENLCEQLGFDLTKKGVRVLTPERLWLYPVEGDSEFNLSGLTDKVIIDGHRILILDYKTGRVEVEGAAENWQLAGYGILEFYADKRLPERIDEVYVAIIQPQASQPVTVARYTPDEIKALKARIDAMLKRAANPHAKALAGEHCKYCSARGACHEAHAYLHQSIVPVEQVQVVKAGRKTEYIIPKLSPSEILRFLDKKPVLEAIIKGLYEQAKAYADAGELEGYELGRGHEVIEFTDMATALERLSGKDKKRKTDAAGCAKFSMERLDTFAEIHLGAAKADARATWRTLLDGTFEADFGEPRLKKVK